MEIITADTLGHGAMRELFNAGFTGYLVPMHLDETAFETHLSANDIDLGASPVLVDADPVAFALVGIRGADAWIGGMGTVPAARRGGRAREVMGAAIASAHAQGCRSLWLEVIDANRPALALYEQLGFETTRDLMVWRLSRPPEQSAAPEADAEAGLEVELERARSWISANRQSAEPWQRSDRALDHLRRDAGELRAAGVSREGNGELVGAVIYAVSGGAARILQIAAADEPTAATLLRSAASGQPLSVGNVPEDEHASLAMESLGAELIARQHEMRLAL